MKDEEIGLRKFEGKTEQWRDWKKEWEQATQKVRRGAKKEGCNLSKMQIAVRKE